ncbi:extracellular solute-binding protein [Tumebacillus permanentifrigoris]|uniref:Carbohydrate ABC transporter substrate-binding protein (CUT1 family) n=1 Tax=Tumebacillus permanentifrigoris TaxID=378543 RepID=A0A316DFU0_9BACL|nr:extracellular solute-binding protein [Tumebacillus permanentifrigoris]PWK16412.1 carbohydrate ABC transporter substrate-binding protein (CUT1 family) [Tumebacillus permanentifrigoris]
MYKCKKVMAVVLTAGLASAFLMGCSQETTKTTTQPDGTVTIDFWAAPNPPQQKYWQQMADEFAKENPKVKVNVSPMPESPSSEAGIQAALAGGSAPTISENISRGFAAQLSDSKALVPLDTLSDWGEIIKNRQMNNTISSWKFADNHQYVLPIYSNAMLFAWRIDMLKQLGYNEPPKTYGDVMALGKKLKDKYPDKYVWANPDLTDPTWWKRWFDFFMLYDAASNGNKFIEGNKLTADDTSGVKTLTFLQDLGKNNLLLTNQSTDPFEKGTSVWTTIGPWTFSTWKEKYPELKFNESYVLSPPPVPDGMSTENVKTFSDTKGLVIYAQAAPEKQKAAMQFIKWVYSKPEHDQKWLEITNLPPARDDMNTNDSFKSYLSQHPELQPFAASIPNGVPPVDNAKFNDLQTTIGKQAVNPVVTGKSDPAAAWNAMKKELQGALK